MMKKYLPFLILFLGSLAFANPLSHLRSINSFDKQGDFFLKINFSQPLSKKDVSLDYIRGTVQFDFDKSVFKRVKKSFSSSFKKINNIYVYQVDQNTVRVRVNLKKPLRASSYRKFIDWDINGSEVFITLNDPAKKIAPVKVVKKEKTPQLKKGNLKKGDLKKVTASSASRKLSALKRPQPAALSETKETAFFSWNNSTQQIVFISVLFMLLLYFRRPRKIFLKKGHFNVLDECHLGTNQQLALVQYKDKKFIVGFTKTEIQILKEDVDSDCVSLDPSADSVKSFSKASFQTPSQEPCVSSVKNKTPLFIKKSVDDYKKEQEERLKTTISLKLKNIN